MFLVEKLVVYQKALDFGERILRIEQRTPRRAPGTLLNQAVRASTSVALNLAEGNGRWTTSDRRHFFHIARGSLYECLPLMEFFRRLGSISEAESTSLRGDMEEISKMLNALIRGNNNKRKAGRDGEMRDGDRMERP